MIAIGIEGRLGNQLFEYAFAYRVAKLIHTMLLIDRVKEYYLPKYFRLSYVYHRIDTIPYVRIQYRKCVAQLQATNVLDLTDCTMRPEEVIAQIKDKTYYKGFFQSAVFFEPTDVKKIFRIRRVYVNQFADKFGEEFKREKTIVVHVRRGDYLTHGLSIGLKIADVSLPKAYYDACFRLIKDLEKYQIYFIGDDMAYAKEIGKAYQDVRYVHESEIIDFQLLMNADICVISNSTYAWWGAYLNKKAEKQVLAPKYFLGFNENKEYPMGIYTGTDYKEIEWR